MDNFSNIALSLEKVSLRKRITSLRKGMDLVKNKDSPYYEHHQHLINTYNEMIDVINTGISESENIGLGL